MEIRKWEDLSTDCLVNVLGRVGIESLILAVPFVCKSWCNATRSPLCWQNLDLSTVSLFQFFKPPFEKRVRAGITGKISLTAFIKCVILRSSGFATRIAFPGRCEHEALVLAANVCPALKTLELPSLVELDHNQHGKLNTVKDLICKWKNLESLTLESRQEMTDILEQIGIHCKSFVSLSIKGTCISYYEASAIVKHIPNIESLSLRQCDIKGADLVAILKGCNQLSSFDISCCNVKNRDDGEILELASCISTVKYLLNKKNHCYLESAPKLDWKVDSHWRRKVESRWFYL
ncbi:hypothetical protein LguiA_001805 [Lonicera macranthoides]